MFMRDRSGASLLEYGLVLGLVAAAGVAAIRATGSEVSIDFLKSADELYSAILDEPLDPDAFALSIRGSSVHLNPAAGGDIQVDWGNKAANKRCGQDFTAGSEISCDYDYFGTYRVAILGDMTTYGPPADSVHNQAIVRVLQWGNTGLDNLSGAFRNAVNLIDVPGNIPPEVTNLASMFEGASSLNDPDLARWDTSSVGTFSHMFAEAYSFNVDIGSWDVSKATNIQAMFRNADAFTWDLNNWDVSRVENMQGVFRETSYNGNISSWDTSSATNMSAMFIQNDAFDQDISGWDTSSAETFEAMFQQAASFSHDVSGWDVSAATNMGRMFWNATSFTSDLSGWCVINITSRPVLFSEGSSINSEPTWGTCP